MSRMLATHTRAGVCAGAAACVVAAALWAAPSVVRAAAPPSEPAAAPIAPAERLLFMTPHLQGVAAQTELDYSLIASGPPEKVNDTVRVLVPSANNASHNASVSDHTGEVPVPAGDLPCNPVVLYFLEHDIAEMEQLTGGQRRYFQKRVRIALAANPPIVQVNANVNGKQIKARKVEIQPYLGDPNAQRFPQYVAKRYTFLFADEVPGGVSQIHTEVPGDNDDFAHPRIAETLSFQAAVHKLPSPQGIPAAPSPNGPRASR